MHEELDERVSREIELEEQLEEAKDKFIAQRDLVQALEIMENQGTRRYRR